MEVWQGAHEASAPYQSQDYDGYFVPCHAAAQYQSLAANSRCKAGNLTELTVPKLQSGREVEKITLRY